MKKGLPLLMMTAILVVAGFQVFWLRENYIKEKNDLRLRTDLLFAETVRNLQAEKLKLNHFFSDSVTDIRIEVGSRKPQPVIVKEAGEVAGFINNVAIRVKDSLNRSEQNEWVEKNNIPPAEGDNSILKQGKRNMIISYSSDGNIHLADSLMRRRAGMTDHPGDIVRFLYRVDSLQDSLRITEIDSAFSATLKSQQIPVAFSVLRNDETGTGAEELPFRKASNKITIGFNHPVSYELKLGNTFSYMAGRLLSPFLFSLFLVGITVLSFLILYRSLLKQKRLAEIKNEFISNITHELKTPIATVGVAIEALQNFNAINDPQRTKEYLDISQNELHRLGLLVDKVLKLSMFENKEIELRYEETDLKEIVDEVASSMKLQLDKSHASVSLHYEGDTRLRGDRLHLLSVVFNLLDNAIKYGNHNTAIQISVKEKESEVELVVADNGIGIPPEYKDKVFEKFFRVPSGDTHNTKGYGLGLSYVAHVVQKHNGKIEVESQQGLGTKFIITLPKTV